MVSGLKGDKGDRGEKGSQADSTIEAIAAAGVATAAAGTAGGFAASAAQSASAAALSNAYIGTRVAALETKTQYQTTGTSLSAVPKTTFSLCDLVVSNGISTQFQASFTDGAVSCGSISSGDITSSGIVKGHIVGDLDYNNPSTLSTINIGRNSTALVPANIINIGGVTDFVYINGQHFNPLLYFKSSGINQF